MIGKLNITNETILAVKKNLFKLSMFSSSLLNNCFYGFLDKELAIDILRKTSIDV
jgi:hypothetical protein